LDDLYGSADYKRHLVRVLTVQALIKAAAKGHTALEINASPARLDLNDTHARRARELQESKAQLSVTSHQRAAASQQAREMAAAARVASALPRGIPGASGESQWPATAAQPPRP